MKIFRKIRNQVEMFNKGSGMVYKSPDPDSTSISDVNLVDGLPSARHAEAVWGAHGVFGPAPICTLDQKMYKIEQTG